MGGTNNKLLYAITVLIWGSTWLAIKFQLGVVAPEVSIVYRLYEEIAQQHLMDMNPMMRKFITG